MSGGAVLRDLALRNLGVHEANGTIERKRTCGHRSPRIVTSARTRMGARISERRTVATEVDAPEDLLAPAARILGTDRRREYFDYRALRFCNRKLARPSTQLANR